MTSDVALLSDGNPEENFRELSHKSVFTILLYVNRSLLFQKKFPSKIFDSGVNMPLGQIATEAATGGVLLKKGVLKNVAKFTEKHLRQSLFNKFTGLRPSTLLKKRLAGSGTGVFLWILQNF